MIAILDYEAGNQTSVQRALSSLGITSEITADPARIGAAKGLIFPGVGAAGQAMRHLTATGLDEVLRAWVRAARPLLGVCLGCQIMLDYSEENAMPTLGLMPGRTRRFTPALREEDGNPISIPHMGWNALVFKRQSRLFAGIPPGAEFYFVHSYYVEPETDAVIATTHYGMDFCSVFGRDGLWALQFHVEKSGRWGLKMLENYYSYCLEHAGAR